MLSDSSISTLLQCSTFLSEILNLRSSMIMSESMKLFLQKFSALVQITNTGIRVQVKPLGKKCISCGKLVKRTDLSKSIALWCNPQDHIMCSAVCLQAHSLRCTNNTLLDLNSIKCPICNVPIQTDIINEVFDYKIEMLQNDACDRALNNLLSEDEKKALEPKFQCEICYESFKVNDGITLECDHRFCSTCINNLCVSNIESGQVTEKSMSCPKCQTVMTMYEIEDIVGPVLFEKYQKFLLRGFKLINEDPNTKIFNCPGIDCEFFCMYDIGIDYIECKKCFLVSCPKCNQKWHEGLTCEEYKASLNSSEDDRLLERLMIQEGIIRCPSCGAAVERISGCEFMVCASSACQNKTYFCFECGRKLERDHEAHDCDKRLTGVYARVAPVAPFRPGRRDRGKRFLGMRIPFKRRRK